MLHKANSNREMARDVGFPMLASLLLNCTGTDGTKNIDAGATPTAVSAQTTARATSVAPSAAPLPSVMTTAAALSMSGIPSAAPTPSLTTITGSAATTMQSTPSAPTTSTAGSSPSAVPSTLASSSAAPSLSASSAPPEVTCPATALASGDSKQMLQVGTLNRSYNLHIPPGYTGEVPLPVVIDFHPLGSTGSGWGGQSGWKTKADSVGFIVVHPESYSNNNSWNVGMCCQDAQQNAIDDVAFTRAIIEHIATIACIDSKRVYATGCSNGGGMTYKVACDLADVVAAAAPVDFRCVYGGSTDSPSCEGCQPSRPISITHFDNTGDNALVPYNGGLTSFPADCPPGQACTGMGFPSAADNFATWQEINECSGATSPVDGHASCSSNGACEGGAQVTMCVQQGGSHCGNYGSLKIVDTAWEMFEKQALP